MTKGMSVRDGWKMDGKAGGGSKPFKMPDGTVRHVWTITIEPDQWEGNVRAIGRLVVWELPDGAIVLEQGRLWIPPQQEDDGA